MDEGFRGANFVSCAFPLAHIRAFARASAPLHSLPLFSPSNCPSKICSSPINL